MIFYLLVVFVAATGPCGKVPELQAKLLYNNNFIFASICKHSVKGNFSKNGKKLKNVNLSQNARLTVLCRRQICLPPLRTIKRLTQFSSEKHHEKNAVGWQFSFGNLLKKPNDLSAVLSHGRKRKREKNVETCRILSLFTDFYPHFCTYPHSYAHFACKIPCFVQ